MSTSDEQSIRDVIARWHVATAAGDVSEILPLMTEDVVFLLPGQPPMRGRDGFAKSIGEALKHFRIESTGDIQEIEIAGEWAWLWTFLTITLHPRTEGQPMKRSGYTLTIMRKQADGPWLLARDANMLSLDDSN